jgi:hypothetical protein
MQSIVNHYNRTMDGRVDYATVTGNYPAIMEQQFIAGSQLDMLYGNPSQATQ